MSLAEAWGFNDLRQPCDHGAQTIARLLATSGLIPDPRKLMMNQATSETSHSYRQPAWKIYHILRTNALNSPFLDEATMVWLIQTSTAVLYLDDPGLAESLLYLLS